MVVVIVDVADTAMDRITLPHTITTIITDTAETGRTTGSVTVKFPGDGDESADEMDAEALEKTHLLHPVPHQNLSLRRKNLLSSCT